MIHWILFLIEFFIIAFLSRFSLGSEEQIIRIFSEDPVEIVISKFLIICLLPLLLSVCMLFISYYLKKDKQLLKKIIIHHSIYILLMTILMLTIKYIQYGYI